MRDGRVRKRFSGGLSSGLSVCRQDGSSILDWSWWLSNLEVRQGRAGVVARGSWLMPTPPLTQPRGDA